MIKENADKILQIKRVSRFSNLFHKFKPLEKNGILTRQGVKNYQKSFMQEKNNYLFGTAYGMEVGLAKESVFTQRNCNQLIVGGAGTGKSYNYTLSNLRQMNHSAVILDYSLSRRNEQERLDKLGVKTHRIDFHSPEKSSRYNPFLHVKTEQQIIMLADNIAEFFDSGLYGFTPNKTLCSKDYEDHFYVRLKKIMIRLAVTYVVKSPSLTDDERTFKTLYDVWAALSDQSAVKKYDITSKYSEIVEVISPDAYAITIRYIRLSFEKILLPEFECFTERADTDNISIEELGSELTYLFISGCPYVSENIKDSYHHHSVCIDFLLSELINHLYSFAEDCFGGKSKYKALSSTHFLPYHVHFYLDEFIYRNIPNFLSILSTVRDYGIGFSVMVQNIDQLKFKYPNNEWLTVPSVCDTQIFLGSCIQEDYEYFATNKIVIDGEKIKGSVPAAYKITQNTCMTVDYIKCNVIGQNKILVCVRDVAPIVCDRLNPENYV